MTSQGTGRIQPGYRSQGSGYRTAPFPEPDTLNPVPSQESCQGPAERSERCGPRVSVSIPTYNHGHFLRPAIESVLSQTFADWELILCDNASTDDTREIVEEYRGRLGSKLRYYRNEQNIGLLGNLNLCWEEARGEYVLILCADDYLDPCVLEQLTRGLDEHPTAALASAYRYQPIEESGAFFGPVRRKKLGPGLVSGEEIVLGQCRWHGSFGLHSHVLMRAAALWPGPIFEARFPLCADNALWCKLAEKWDAVFVEEAVVYTRFHDTSLRVANEKSLADIPSTSAMFHWLFNESPCLKGRRWIRYQFVRDRLYLWFDRAVGLAQRGEWGKCFYILRSIAAFSRVPWWFPYFLVRKVRRSLQLRLRTNGRSGALGRQRGG